jgi:hypothetical protein
MDSGSAVVDCGGWPAPRSYDQRSEGGRALCFCEPANWHRCEGKGSDTVGGSVKQSGVPPTLRQGRSYGGQACRRTPQTFSPQRDKPVTVKIRFLSSAFFLQLSSFSLKPLSLCLIRDHPLCHPRKSAFKTKRRPAALHSHTRIINLKPSSATSHLAYRKNFLVEAIDNLLAFTRTSYISGR